MLHLNYKNTVNGFDYMNELSKIFLNTKNGDTSEKMINNYN